MTVNPGSLAGQIPYGDDYVVRKQRDMERGATEQAAARSLGASQIGSGGLLVNEGGSITIQGTGQLNVASGGLNSAGSIVAGTTIAAGTNITAGGTIAATGALSGAAISGTSLNVGGGTATVGQINASGGITASGPVVAGGAVSGTTGTFNSGLYSTNARNFVVVSNYAASWIDVNGHFGISPSTERFKKDIVPWVEADPENVFGVTPVKYHLRIPDRYMPVVDEANVPVIDPLTGIQEQRLIEGYEEAATDKLRTGFIAERLVELGFEENVVFDEQGLPVSINYAEWVVPLQMGIRHLRTLVKTQQAQIDALSLRVSKLGG
jgi:hypothetical protein